MIHLVEDGNVEGMPALTKADVRRAYDLYGTHPAYVRGEMTKRAIGRTAVNHDLVLDEKRQALYTDVMHVEGRKFLVSVCEPLQLTFQCPVESEGKTALGLGLQGQLNLLKSRNFQPTIVYTDPASAFKSITREFPGVEIDTGGAKDNVAKIDSKIRRIKELMRSVKNSLPLRLPRLMVKDLVAYAVARINIKCTTAISS